MNYYDYLIVGGGVAGVTAAETIREGDAHGSIAVISQEPHPLYSRVLLPHFVKGLIGREQLFLRAAEDYRAKNIRLHLGRDAVDLDAAGRRIRLAGGEEMLFGNLLIATGGRPRPLGIAGEEIAGVSRFQTIEDAERMRERLPRATRAVVVGGGFIALEYLDILSRAGIPTALLVAEPHFFSRFVDAAGGEFLHDHFRRNGVEPIVTNDGLAEIRGGSALSGIRTQQGRTIACDFLGIGIGLAPRVSWLAGSGVAFTPRGVAANEFLETTVPGVFVAGDIADVPDAASRQRTVGGTWGNAVLQGRVAGRNLAAASEGREPYRNIPAYAIRCLGFFIACIGRATEAPDVEAVSRIGRGREWYERFFFRGDRLVGAVLINRPEDQRPASVLIGEGVALGAARARFSEEAFDMASVIP